MSDKLHIIPAELLGAYTAKVDDKRLKECFERLTEAEISTGTFSFYTSVSSVFSSKIEGEDIELDSYIKHKKYGIEFLPDYTRKIDDLYDAYLFAQNNHLSKENVREAHKRLSRHILASHQQGKIRTQNMYVITPEGSIEYVAASPFEVEAEMEKLYHDIGILIRQSMTISEVFFYASMLHLVFAKIHPFNDGNGRSARLIEKWFLAQKLGQKSWYMQSEKLYYSKHNEYYKNIRALGLEYPELDYSKALNFLLMLPQSIL